ncbi:MAG: metallophosphoesterase [Acidobacteriota bacterium]|nr:metallophosphoesterase [Acidobacteriota bacterium]
MTTSILRRIAAHKRVWRVVRWSLGILAAASLVAIAWGAGVEPRLLDERFESVRIPALLPEWSGARVALVADLQIGMWLANTDTIRRIVDRVIEQRPAALLIAGDFLYHPTGEAGEPREARAEMEREDVAAFQDQIAEVVALLAPLMRAGIRTVVVLGNHDYAMRVPESLPLPIVADDLSRALRAIGVVVLRNAATPLGGLDAGHAPERRLFVAGLDAWMAQATDVNKTLAQIPDDAPRLFLMHNPLSFRQLPAGTAPVALGAHTHGGQIRLPFTPRWSWMSLVKESPVAADGWIASDFGAAGNRLYVNRGIGFSVVPIRINCRPELTWFTLEP